MKTHEFPAVLARVAKVNPSEYGRQARKRGGNIALRQCSTGTAEGIRRRALVAEQ